MYKRIVLALLSLCAIGVGASAPPAKAMVILDSTWRANGGSIAHETRGFGANEALAAQPQFAGTVSVAVSDGAGSGVWIGNDGQNHAVILTAAHLMVDVDANNTPTGLEDPKYVTVSTDRRGTVTEYRVSKLIINPDFDVKNWASADLALLVLTRPFPGPQPLLYCGVEEAGKVGTMVGYGLRGIGSVGEDSGFQAALGVRKLAVHNRVDAADFAGGGTLTVDFDEESDDPGKPFGSSDDVPIDKYEGLPSNGDSGAPLWLKTDSGWEIAGIVKGGPDTSYGNQSQLMRVSGFQDWLHQALPQALFDDGHGSNCGADVVLPTAPEAVVPSS